jgi:hypothetical protein
MSLTNLNFLDNEAKNFRQAKNQIELSQKNIQTAIETNTKPEVEAVNDAIKNLNQKVELILNTQQIKAEEEKLKTSQKQITSSIQIASETYFKVLKIIKDKNLPKEKRIEYQKQLYKKIIEKFLTPEEIEEFERFIRMGPMMMIGNPIDSRMIGGPLKF